MAPGLFNPVPGLGRCGAVIHGLRPRLFKLDPASGSSQDGRSVGAEFEPCANDSGGVESE